MGELSDLLKSPWTLAGVITSAIATSLATSLTFADTTWGLIASTADLWFPLLAVFSTTIADSVPWIPADPVQQLLLAGALLYVAILASRLYRRTRNKIGGS